LRFFFSKRKYGTSKSRMAVVVVDKYGKTLVASCGDLASRYESGGLETTSLSALIATSAAKSAGVTACSCFCGSIVQFFFLEQISQLCCSSPTGCCDQSPLLSSATFVYGIVESSCSRDSTNESKVGVYFLVKRSARSLVASSGEME